MGPIALVVGELTAYLNVDNDQYKRGIRDAKGDLNSLARDAARQSDAAQTRTTRVVNHATRSMQQTGVIADREGRKSGGRLAQGIEMGFIRHSPLIAAAVGGALVAGAPLVLSGATVLFGGIGIVAAAQSKNVQSAWKGAWTEIKQGAIADASVLQETLWNLSTNVRGAFEYMRPAMRNIFADLGPQIDTLTIGVLRFAMHAMPGFERAIARNMPVIEGFADFLETVGTGLTDFLDNMSEHAPAAGEAFGLLGDAFAELLPALGELLGQGAELATIVLPPLVSALGGFRDVLEMVGPLLPGIVAAMIGFKVAQSAAGWIGSLTAKLGELAVQGGASQTGALATGLGKVSAAAGPAAAAIGGVTAIIVAWSEAAKRAEAVSSALGRAMAVGGQQAEAASQYIKRFALVNNAMDSGVLGSVSSISILGTSLRDLIPDAEQSEAAYSDWYKSLDPAGRAAENLAIAQDALGQAIRDHGPASKEATVAGRQLAGAQREVERAAADEEMAIRGVTSAMIEQANQALAAIDSSFAYRHSVDQLEDSQAALNEAMKSGSPEDMRRAFLDLEEQNYRTAASYGQQQADLSGLTKDSAEYARVVQTSMLEKLYELRDAAGPKMAAAIQQQIDQLERAGVQLDDTGNKASGAAKKVDDLGKKYAKPRAELIDRVSPAVGPIISRILGIPAERMTTSKIWDRASAVARNIASAIFGIPVSRTSSIFVNTYHRTYGQSGGGAPVSVAAPNRAMGGPIPRLSVGGQIIGPGTSTSDSILGVDRRGIPRVWVSDDEWIVNARRAQEQGALRMAALNAGRADIVLRNQPRVRALAGGGPVSETATIGPPMSGGMSIHGDIVVKVETPLNLMNDQDLRRAGKKLRGVIIELERAGS